MIEFLSIKIDSVLDLSLIAAFIGAIAFYFGKIINEISPQKENPYINYVQGFVFITIFIVFPLLVFYVAQTHLQSIDALAGMFVQAIVGLVLSLRYNAFQMEKLDLRGKFNKELAEKSAVVSQKIKPIPSNTDQPIVWKAVNVVFFARLPDWLLILFSVLTINAAIKMVFSPESPVLVFISLFIAFASISITAALFGWNMVRQYPEITAYLVNGIKKTGQMTKIDGGYVSMISGDKIIHIPESQILLIEMDKFKKGKDGKIEK